MAISVVMPALEMAQETGKLLAWRKKEGESVRKGEPLLEIETDKAVVEVRAHIRSDTRGGNHCVAGGPGRAAAGTGCLGCTGSALEERRGAANSGSDPGCGGYEDGSRQCASRDFTESAASRERIGSGFCARAWHGTRWSDYRRGRTEVCGFESGCSCSHG